MMFEEYPVLFYEFKTKHKKARIAIAAVLGVVAVAIFAMVIYAASYYRASDRAGKLAAARTDEYDIVRFGTDIAFLPDAPIAGFAFYPGGKVEYTAYAPLMSELARRGIACYLVEMPLNLAVLDSAAANRAIKNLPDVKRWYVGGHSLGGAIAASYVSVHMDTFEGLVLLGAYSTSDLSKSGLRVVSVYGSEDRVLNMEKYALCTANLPVDHAELRIDGGCHAYFGDYGPQAGDGTPTITAIQQQTQTADFISTVILSA